MKMLKPVMKEQLAPKEFLELVRTRHQIIRSSKFIPPQLGDHTVGTVEVEYRVPRLISIRDHARER